MGQLEDRKLAKGGSRGKNSQRAASRLSVERAAWRGYVNVHVEARFREQWEAWVADDDLVYGALSGVLSERYKVSLWYDDSTQAIVCTLYCNDLESPNAGYAMTARAAAPLVALAKTLFQHEVVTGRDWRDWIARGVPDNWAW